MAEDNCPKTSDECMANEAAAAVRHRKKRKWDQPAESLISAGLAASGVLPKINGGSIVGISLPGAVPLLSASWVNPVPATSATISQTFQAPLVQQNMAAVVQKLIQPKIQDEVIAREIVINDAESTIRYKLTKRQTQEEIQRCTGAVVITRGKYHPPSVPPDGERPLYLHISAGAHLKETAERIKAVDRAAVMIEEMLKQGHFSLPNSAQLSTISTGAPVLQLFSASVFLGFEPDPLVNIVASIRGPNDQYINHIMNETGATVLLRGKGAENLESQHEEDSQQPLHLHLSCNNPKGLEDAKVLAENLLDTIATDCSASRLSSSKAYNAVPPPQTLLSAVQSSLNVVQVNTNAVSGLTSLTTGSTPMPPSSPSAQSGLSNASLLGTVLQSGSSLNYGKPSSNTSCHSQPSISGGTCYSGYGGIYPQATPLQQVALVLKQSPSPINCASSANPTDKMLPEVNSKAEKEKMAPPKRKFQELPLTFKGPAKSLQNSLQGSEFLKPGTLPEDSSLKSILTMPPPKKLVQPFSNGMPPPPPRTMPPPPPKMMPQPPPPKFTSSPVLSKANGRNPEIKSSSNPLHHKSRSEPVPDTLIKLMEYGEDDDDDEETTEEEPPISNFNAVATPKPFWAL